MRNLLVKICGITNVVDALAAVDAGADFIGVILVPDTARFVTDDVAREIVAAVGGRVKTVAVFRDAEAGEMNAKRDAIGFDLVQLHGNEPQAVVDACAPCIKAYSVEPRHDMPRLHLAAGDECVPVAAGAGAEYLLLDRPKGSADEGWLDNMVEALRSGGLAAASPFLLAGGLTVERVSIIIDRLRDVPNFAGVDVASGVERAPGLKDHDKLMHFISSAKEAHRHAVTG
jgi:phosphoribosylanthranilate isomerase